MQILNTPSLILILQVLSNTLLYTFSVCYVLCVYKLHFLMTIYTDVVHST